MPTIADALTNVREQVASAALESGRDPESVRVLAVSKTFPHHAVLEASEAGQILFGENRVQEAMSKIPLCSSAQLEWHLIGHLQSNKARLAAELFDVIQSVDSERLARRLDRVSSELGRVLSVFIQVNIGREGQKFGVDSNDLAELVLLVESLANLRLRGLMTIPPFEADPEKARPYFRELFELKNRIQSETQLPLPELSMGMSGDFRVAIQEGATLVRIGTAIFGKRG